MRARATRVLRVLYVWLLVGFIMGTAVLLGPVRWSTEAARQAGWNQQSEDVMVMAIIGAYVLSSLVLALWLGRGSAARPAPSWQRRSPMWLSGLALATVAVWLQPAMLIGAGGSAETESQVVEAGGARFHFGPYPTREDLVRLEAEGYAGVISLLHPAVVPFEPKLMRDEARAASNAGIDLISLPMLPWIGDNRAALDSIQALARSGSGRYYVHCYLGRDRVAVALRAITDVSGELVDADMRPSPELEMREHFERGEVITLEDSVHLSPFPTDEEFFAYVVGGGIRTVVSLLNPERESDVQWIERETAFLEQHGIPLVSLPLQRDPYDPDQVLELVRHVKTLPRPLLVHAFLAQSPETAAFQAAYTADVPPVLAERLVGSLSGGIPVVLVPNLVVGPRPEAREYGAVLKRAGVQRVLYVGPPGGPARVDSIRAAGADLPWRGSPEIDAALRAELAMGGPWYVYGPGAADLR
jgi:protein tyrosine phosphatase (PTP) superfamily phosphohydrolase (DUF442 family)